MGTVKLSMILCRSLLDTRVTPEQSGKQPKQLLMLPACSVHVTCMLCSRLHCLVAGICMGQLGSVMHCHWDTAAKLSLLNAMVPPLEAACRTDRAALQLREWYVYRAAYPTSSFVISFKEHALTVLRFCILSPAACLQTTSHVSALC